MTARQRPAEAPVFQAGLKALLASYTDEQLRENYAQAAAEFPGTEWHRLLSAEVRRRRTGPGTTL